MNLNALAAQLPNELEGQWIVEVVRSFGKYRGVHCDAALRDSFHEAVAAAAKSVVKDYTEMMKSGCTLPPVEVVRDSASGQLYLVDGYHRVDAAKRLKRTVIDAQITDGTYTDAIRCAIKVNAAHGLRRSNADKRNALKMAWEHRQELFGGEPSHEVLAAACAVSKRTAQRFRETASGMDNVHPCAHIGKDGKSYQLPTTNYQLTSPPSPTASA